MLTKKLSKFILSLHRNKGRLLGKCFLVEGEKTVLELMRSSLSVEYVFHSKALPSFFGDLSHGKEILVTEAEMKIISSQSNPSGILAIAKIPESRPILENTKMVLVLDGIRDPGNLGTIIRLSEWFGVNDIVCSSDCVDAYNPKVVQSAMGSLFRSNICYTNLESFFSQTRRTIYGAFLDGKTLDGIEPNEKSAIVIGSESHGISTSLENIIHHKITIPRYSGNANPESLNAANACAICLAHFAKKLS